MGTRGSSPLLCFGRVAGHFGGSEPIGSKLPAFVPSLFRPAASLPRVIAHAGAGPMADDTHIDQGLLLAAPRGFVRLIAAQEVERGIASFDRVFDRIHEVEPARLLARQLGLEAALVVVDVRSKRRA